MLRGTSDTARAPEWLAMTGAFDTSSACAIVVSATWLTSTIMPSRFISATTCRPNGDRPPARTVPVELSAHSSDCEWVSVMYATPSALNWRRTARFASIW